MILFKCISRGATKRGWLVFGVFMLLSLLGFTFMNVKGGLLPQAVFLFSLIIAIYILVRYVTNAYVYEVVDDGEDGLFFLAVRLHGKKMLTQCKLPLSALTVVARTGKGTPPRVPISNFSPILFAEDDTLLYFEAEKAILRVSLSEEFVAALKKALPSVKDAFDAPSDTDNAQSGKRKGPYDLSDLTDHTESK